MGDFQPSVAKTEHTGYARVTKIMLKQTYGIDHLTRDNLGVMAEKLSKIGSEEYLSISHRIGDQGRDHGCAAGASLGRYAPFLPQPGIA